MAALCRPKKGRCCRKNQAREGDKVDGTGRWPGHSFGSATGECFTSGSHARRSDHCSGPRPVLGRGRPRQKPKRIIADRAYDSNPLRDRLQKRGIELLVPHRRNRQRWWRQDGRKLRRYRKRWKVERTFAWLQNFRRLLVRQDRILTVYRGLFHFACLLITLRYL